MAKHIELCDFVALKSGMPGLTSAAGTVLSEAASVCLSKHTHPAPVALSVQGDLEKTFLLGWDAPTEQVMKTHADLQDATEFGACGVAIILAKKLTGKLVVSRSVKGTGIDYWLGDTGDSDDLFQQKARLEVSGILSGDEARVAARVKVKLSQTKPSDKSTLPAYVAVVEFGQPRAVFVTKKNGGSQ